MPSWWCFKDFSAHVLGVAIDESYLMPYDGYRHGHHVDKALASRVPDGILSGDLSGCPM